MKKVFLLVSSIIIVIIVFFSVVYADTYKLKVMTIEKRIINNIDNWEKYITFLKRALLKINNKIKNKSIKDKLRIYNKIIERINARLPLVKQVIDNEIKKCPNYRCERRLFKKKYLYVAILQYVKYYFLAKINRLVTSKNFSLSSKNNIENLIVDNINKPDIIKQAEIALLADSIRLYHMDYGEYPVIDWYYMIHNINDIKKKLKNFKNYIPSYVVEDLGYKYTVLNKWAGSIVWWKMKDPKNCNITETDMKKIILRKIDYKNAYKLLKKLGEIKEKWCLYAVFDPDDILYKNNRKLINRIMLYKIKDEHDKEKYLSIDSLELALSMYFNYNAEYPNVNWDYNINNVKNIFKKIENYLVWSNDLEHSINNNFYGYVTLENYWNSHGAAIIFTEMSNPSDCNIKKSDFKRVISKKLELKNVTKYVKKLGEIKEKWCLYAKFLF
jgi:hypothetical protein